MTVNEGKNFLQDCLNQIGKSLNIEEIIYYKYGRGRKAEDYHHDIITTDVNLLKSQAKVRYVVKCFT